MLSESYVLSFILIILYLTDALPTYFRLVGFGQIKKLLIKEYFNEKATTITYFPENYLEYLNLKYKSFFLDLLSCPFCLNFWLALLLTFSFNFSFNIVQITQIYIEGLIMFLVIKYLSQQGEK